MLTSLDWLRVGGQFPPKDYDTSERMRRYAKNKAIFEGKHADVFEEQFKRIERVIGNFGEIISYPVVLNYQKLISLKVGDLLFGEFPHISAGEEDGVEHETVESIMDSSDLINTLYESAIDVSRYGDGILYVYNDNGVGMIDVSQPSLWFPIVSNDNIKIVINHVLAWTYEIGEKYYLKAQIHYKGYYEEQLFTLEKSMSSCYYIKQMISSNIIKTGLDDFAVIHIPNVMTSDRVTGIDDYHDIESIVSELLVRIGQVSRVLDKHAAPSVSGPSTALEKDPTSGEWKLKMGNYFPRDSSDEPTVDYITWDAGLESSFKQIENLVNNLYVISEMGAILLGEVDKMGNAVSGTALRLKMMSPLSKVRRVAKRFTPAIKKAINLCSQLGGEGIVNLKDTKISITWMDGIPNDDKEIADIINIRTGGKPSMSTKRALMQYDEMSSDDADAEIELIQEEEAMSNPIIDTLTNANMGDAKDKELIE